MPIFIDAREVHIKPETHAARIQAEGRRMVRITPVFVSEQLSQPAHIHHDKGVTTVWEETRVATDGKSVWPLRAPQFKNDYVERAHTDQLRDELVRFARWIRTEGGGEPQPGEFEEIVELYLNREGA